MTERIWELWRQDDNGQKFLMARFEVQDEAENQRRAYEAKGHKQHYWVVERPPASESTH